MICLGRDPLFDIDAQVPKKYPEQTLIGQLGVNLIERRVLQMGWVWNATHIEAGIDGYIEIRDPSTGRATNLILQVQSKATSKELIRETSDTFEFPVEERDLEYWLSGNAPVILICSRPSTDEAYWVDLKDYFRNPSSRISRRIAFNKKSDSFGIGARERLQALAIPRNSGVYLAPPPRTETLITNLLPVVRLAPHLKTAATTFTDGRVIRSLLGSDAQSPDAWVLKNKRVLSFSDLGADAWRDVIEQGSIEMHPTSDWARSDDVERRNEFSDLLMRTLRAKFRKDHIAYDRDGRYFYFMALATDIVRKVGYASLRRHAERTVVHAVLSKKNRNHIQYFRHAAFVPQFVRYDGQWHLVIVPTYHFTSDGWRPYPWYESKLKGIKALEKNAAVLGQVVMWAALLADQTHQLFGGTESPHFGFGDLVSGPIDAGVNEDWWLTNEDDASVARGAPLFESSGSSDEV
jgi:hypothetical protein